MNSSKVSKLWACFPSVCLSLPINRRPSLSHNLRPPSSPFHILLIMAAVEVLVAAICFLPQRTCRNFKVEKTSRNALRTWPSFFNRKCRRRLCLCLGDWAFTNWVSIKDVQHFQKHKKRKKNKNETKIKHAKGIQTRVEQLRLSELQNVPLREKPEEREWEASPCFEASPAMLGEREANSVDKQPQQRTDALQSYSTTNTFSRAFSHDYL